LSSHEAKWRDRQQFLESKGYMLRPRLRPRYFTVRGSCATPSEIHRFFRSLEVLNLDVRVMLADATRISDGKLVYIKEVRTGDEESRIALMLSGLASPQNHSVPILDRFLDDADRSISYLVMPFLRLCNSPPFDFIEEILDFEDARDMAVLHLHGVAHHDCAFKNLLMDGAASMYFTRVPPVVFTTASVLLHLDVGVEYYFVDYGISSYFPPESQHRLVLGRDGRDQDVSELSDEVPYDSFKVDIFTMGNNLRIKLQPKYSNLGFFAPMIESLTRDEPNLRPSAEEALQQWRTIRHRVHFLHRYWRLREYREPLLIVVILDAIHDLKFLPRFARRLYRIFV
ncbi:hypothetical protein BC834DRAFT_829955, partial [Gloeopeniophorella convolvens]